MIIVLVPRTFIRFYSVRTGQTLLHANRLEGALIVYGDARLDRYTIKFDGKEGAYRRDALGSQSRRPFRSVTTPCAATPKC